MRHLDRALNARASRGRGNFLSYFAANRNLSNQAMTSLNIHAASAGSAGTLNAGIEPARIVGQKLSGTLKVSLTPCGSRAVLGTDVRHTGRILLSL
jgi:hypothetical protein